MGIKRAEKRERLIVGSRSLVRKSRIRLPRFMDSFSTRNSSIPFHFFSFVFFASRKFMDLAAVYIYPRIYPHGRTGTAGMLNINVLSYKSRLRLDAPRRVEIYRFSNEFSRSNERPRCCFLTEGRFIFRMKVSGTIVILINSGELKIIRSRQVLLNTFEIMNF